VRRRSLAASVTARRAASTNQTRAVVATLLAFAGYAHRHWLTRSVEAQAEVKVADFSGHIHLIGHYAATLTRRLKRSTRDTGTLRASAIGKNPNRSPPVMRIRDIGRTAAGRSFSPVEATIVATTLTVFSIVVTPCRSRRR
jgi:hypothetical protein